MRVLTVMLSVVALACGKSAVPDAGLTLDSGLDEIDAGFVAPLCIDDKQDAGSSDGGLDFSCSGRARAPGGQAELVLAGKVTRAGFVRTPVTDVLVDLVALDGTVLASAVSGDGGIFRLTYDAGCFPLEGEVRATHPSADAGYSVAYAAPGVPYQYDRTTMELVLFDASTRGLAAGIAGVNLIDGGAALALTVEDCVGNAVQGALISTVGANGDVRYVGASGLPTTTQMSTARSGQAVIFNLFGTSVEVIATLDGGVIAQRAFPVHAEAASGTTLSP